jgi:hypothetical protein
VDTSMDKTSLTERLDYSPITGEFRWKVTAGSRKAGDIAGSVFNNGYGMEYIRIKCGRRTFFAHRLAWLFANGEWPDGYIDHINHDGLDNRISNLRTVDNETNQKNAKLPSHNTSGLSGVCFVSKTSKWHAYFSRNKNQVHIGSFLSLFDAAAARKSAELVSGYHANHGKSA